MHLAAPVARALAWAGAAPGLTLWLAPYQAGQFDAARFTQAGIACPPAVALAVRQRQAEYFYGRLCARAALAQWGMGGVEVGTGPAREPLWPARMVGSITHSRSLAGALALPAARYRGVGIDIESYADPAALASIVGMVLNAREVALLRGGRGELTEATLLSLAFSAKESFYKAVFGVVQRFVDFNAIEIDELDAERGRIGFTLIETLCDDWPRGKRWHAAFELLDEQQVLTGVLW